MPRKFDFISPGIQITEIDQSVLPAEADNDGPIIIGRTARGPAFKPVKIRSLEDYIAIFGAPNPGGGSPSGDLWRDGAGSGAPTYASYAAQSWLAGGTSPITMVRLLGDQNTNAQAGIDTLAGWKLSGSMTAAQATNSTAYGLFVIDKAKTGDTTNGILNITSFDVTSLGGGATTSTILSFFHGATINQVANPLTTGDGLVFQINFDNSVTAGSIVRIENAGGDGATGFGRNQTGGVVTVYSIGIDEASDTQTTVMGYIESAINQAISNGDISDISVDNETTKLKIHNLSTTKKFNISNRGRAGVHDGASNPSDFDFSADGTSKDLNNSGGTELAIADAATGTGALAAIFYANRGSLALKGIEAGGTAAEGSCLLVESDDANIGFTIVAKDQDGVKVKEKSFNFNRNSGKYIRKVFNTNPTLVNSGITPSTQVETHWLGETFERHLKTYVTTDTKENQYAVLLPLVRGSVNWADRNEGYCAAQSGWVFSQNTEVSADYDAATQPKMFKFHALQEGADLQKRVFIAFENFVLPPNPESNPFSTFDVVIKSISGTTLERFSSCTMNKKDSNYIARRIGDMFMEWDESQLRWRSYGDFINQSDYIRIEMAEASLLPPNEDALPFGFLGPGMPKGFSILDGNATAKKLDGTEFETGGFVSNGDAGDPGGHGNDFIKHNLTDLSIKFEWPKLKLRSSGTQGFAANPYQAMYGIRPKISDNSSLHDGDYVDYLRGLPASLRAQIYAPTGDFEHSIKFTLDDLVINEDTNVVTYTAGSHKLNNAFTSTNNVGAENVKGTVEDLINLGVSNWAMPLFGGFDGLDITEVEPFSRNNMSSADTIKSNYLANSFELAVNSVRDPEQNLGNILLAPGFVNTHLTNKLLAVADERQDVLAIIDLEGDYHPEAEATNSDTQQSRRGNVKDIVSKLKSRNLDTSFGCAFAPWIQISDNLNGSELVWVPPSIAGLGAMARSEAASDVWFAPAGFNRGGLGSLGGPSGPTVVQARQRLDVKDRDKLYGIGVNPIASFPNEGVVVFGQKTLQKANSALDRINVRRLMIYLKREIGNVAKQTLFQNNVPATWADFKGRAEPILSDVKNRFGLTDYRLILDETTTTPDLIDRNIMYAKVFLKPARAIEFIAIDFVITKTGADFV